MNTPEVLSQLLEKFGSHPAVAEQLGISLRQYQRIRKAGKAREPLEKLMQLLISDTAPSTVTTLCATEKSGARTQ
jgi:hypothetical protein